MSLRKEVFQAKVLQRLYPTTLKVEKAPDTRVQQPQADKSIKGVQLQPSKVTSQARVPAVLGRKVYTVLPPPEDYIPASADGLGSPIDAPADDNADELAADLSGSENRSAAEDDHTSRIRKRRRKRKPATSSEENPPTPAAEDQTAEGGGERNNKNSEGLECLSKNKRRKMKKRRHKEKLLALGLVPQSKALEFTYKQSEEDKEKEVEEVVDFLQSTQDLYLSDRSRSTADTSVFLTTTNSLFTRLSNSTSPPAVLSVLRQLRALLRHSQVETLHAILQELTHASMLPKDEIEAIYTLFHYWITEVLPMRTKRKA